VRSKKIILFIISLVTIGATTFAPLPQEFAVNYENKQCAEYWGGDEFVTYDLPGGWKTFEPQNSEFYDYIVETDIGTCQVSKADIDNTTYEEACCSQIGYEFVPGNIGIRRYTPEKDLTMQAQIEEINAQGEQAPPIGFYISFFIIFILFLAIFILFMLQNRKE
jgi:hypothetical protein